MTVRETTRGERSPRVKDSLISTQVNDFIIEERIGEGGMGVVYRAVHPLIGKQVAIKVLRAEHVTQQQVERLLIEARAVNSIRHPGIIDIFGFGRLPDSRPYIIMELLRGQSLSESLKQLGRLDPNTTAWILDQILSALGAAHKAGVVHRDMKPGNVFLAEMLDGSRAVRLVDFGIAKLVRSHDGPTTVDGTILGTPEYMAPEQIRGTTVTSATDLYAVGIMAFQMLTGERPFKGEQLQVLFAHVEQPPPLPSSLVPGIAPEFDTLVLHLLAKDPALRPESAEAVQQALKRIPPTVVPPFGPGTTATVQPIGREGGTKSTWSQVKLPHPTTRRGRVWLAAGAALLSSVATATFLLSPWGPGRAGTTPVPTTVSPAEAPHQNPPERAPAPAPPPPTQEASAQPLAVNDPALPTKGATPNLPEPGSEGSTQPSNSAAHEAASTPAVSDADASTATPAVHKAATDPKQQPSRPTPRHPAAFLPRGEKAPPDPKLVQRVYNLEERYLKQTSGRAPSEEFEKELKHLHARALKATTRAESTQVSASISTLTQHLRALQAPKVATAPPSSADTHPEPTPPPPSVVPLRAPGPHVLAMLTTPALTPSDDRLARRFVQFKAMYLERASKHEYPRVIEESLVRIHDLAMKETTATERMDIHRALDAWKEVLDHATPK
nr:serine/threonine protein kinase [Myxococcus sp. CA039A]